MLLFISVQLDNTEWASVLIQYYLIEVFMVLNSKGCYSFPFLMLEKGS